MPIWNRPVIVNYIGTGICVAAAKFDTAASRLVSSAQASQPDASKPTGRRCPVKRDDQDRAQLLKMQIKAANLADRNKHAAARRLTLRDEVTYLLKNNVLMGLIPIIDLCTNVSVEQWKNRSGFYKKTP
jgi:hypothetical protein